MIAKEYFKKIFKEQYRKEKHEHPDVKIVNLKRPWESMFMYKTRGEAMEEVDKEETR